METTLIEYCDIDLEILYEVDYGEKGSYLQPPVSPSIEIIAIRLATDKEQTDIYELVREVDVKTIEEIVYENHFER